jgi:cysteine desulfurase family protein (TIGR01976 family)
MPPPFDVDAARAHFPALERRHQDRPVLYFDNPAGTQVPREMVDRVTGYLKHSNANTGGDFPTSQGTDRIIAETRAAMADFLGAASPDGIVFGQNMTSLTFHLSHALRTILRPGDEIVTTRLEHDANVAPWLALQDRGVVVRFIDFHPEDGTLDLEGAEELITERTRLLAVGYASNALGTVNEVCRLTEIARSHGALVFVDAVHYAPHGPIDVGALGCDFLVCSPYKFFGPHLGVLYGRSDTLRSVPAPHVRPAGDEPPFSWETGTQSHEALSGLLGTVGYLCSLSDRQGDRRTQLQQSMTRVNRYERALSRQLISGLGALPRVRVYGMTDEKSFDRRVPTVSFTVADYNPFQLSAALAERGVFSWAGNHYAVEPLARLGLEATNRVGLVHYNTPEEVDRFLETLEDVI